MAKNVDVELGCTIDLVNQNIDLIVNMEHTRRELYLQNIKNQEGETKINSSPSSIDIGDVVLEELCTEAGHSATELELDSITFLEEEIFFGNGLLLETNLVAS